MRNKPATTPNNAAVPNAMCIRRGFRYRIYPTAEQAARLDKWGDALRFLWNLAHEQRLLGLARPRHGFKRDKELEKELPLPTGWRRYYTAFDQINQLTDLRAELPWLADVPRDVCAQLLVGLDLAWQCCFKKIAAAPQWKRKGRDILGCIEPHPKAWRLDVEHGKNGVLHFPKLGPVRAVVHRPLVGTPKTCTISRDGDQWFVSISCQITTPAPTPSTLPPIGIDRGCVNLIADSSEHLVPNPRHLRRAERRLAHAQRVVSRRKKGSNNREKAKHRVARIHRKVRRQRDAELHRESKFYANNHGTIFVERLSIKGMSADGGARKRGLNKSIMSAGWGSFVEMCRYKSVPVGGQIIDVPAPGTSQECNVCCIVDARSRRSQAVFRCIACGHEEHADTNAAKNVLARGLRLEAVRLELARLELARSTNVNSNVNSITAVEPTVAVCGGLAEVRLPSRQKLRVVRRGTRSHAGLGSSKASAFRPG